MQANLTTIHGSTILQFNPALAPNHCELIKHLINGGFYDGLAFHRVIQNFMAQFGCPLGNGAGGVSFTVKAEFSNTPFVRGSIGMARSQSVDSSSSQMFICTADTPFLNGQYTHLGHVISGMESIDKIKLGPQDTGMVVNPDRIISIRLI